VLVYLVPQIVKNQLEEMSREFRGSVWKAKSELNPRRRLIAFADLLKWRENAL
jgi:hypothetical protein